MKILITGGSGFIGSALIRKLLSSTDFQILNLDKLTYAADKLALSGYDNSPNYIFKKADIFNKKQIENIISDFLPDGIIHLAAESHVDRSILDPSNFIKSNIIGTFNLLEVSRQYFSQLSDKKKRLFRFHHVSTDEVYGDLKEGNFFTENTSYAPSSPYSSTKASSDHLVRAWHRTYGLPVVITNCSNNYGPFQNKEKLIPLTIHNAIHKNEIPIYGSGLQVRDWLYVADHAEALIKVYTDGEISETYNVGGNNEKTNIEVVRTICSILDTLLPTNNFKYESLIRHVEDRKGHDYRYAIDSSKIQNSLGWLPLETFDTGIKKTIEHYVKDFLKV